MTHHRMVHADRAGDAGPPLPWTLAMHRLTPAAPTATATASTSHPDAATSASAAAMAQAAAVPLRQIQNRAARCGALTGEPPPTFRAQLVDELMRELGITPWEQIQAGCSPAARRAAVATTVAREIETRAAPLRLVPTDVRVFAHPQPGRAAPRIMISAWNRLAPPTLRVRHPAPDPAGWDPHNPLDDPGWRVREPDLSQAPICFGLYGVAPDAFG